MNTRPSTNNSETVVIGGGASGLMCACLLARAGGKVVLVEKNDVLGKKLRITGKGRCNVTNNCDNETVLANIPRNSKFMFASLRGFSTSDTMSFFEGCGVKLKTERGNRVFPESDKAADIAEALIRECLSHGVTIKKDEVTSVEKLDDDFLVKCRKEELLAKNVVVATGGASYRACGSTGDGYKIAKRFGHTVVEPKASLVPLVSMDSICADCMGLSLKNVLVRLIDGKKELYSEQGEMLFTHFGVSGPVVLSASAHIRNFPITMSIDLKPALDETTLDARLLRDFEKNKNKEFHNSLDELLPKKLIPAFVERSGIEKTRRVNEITRAERRKLVELLKGLKFEITGTRPINEAIITAGGIKCGELNPSTMESKLVKGLYFVGEVIDVDAYTGGFNLQIAFSTAASAARAIKKGETE